MADKEIGTVESQAGKYRVLWNDRSGKVYVKKMAAFLAGWERCDAMRPQEQLQILLMSRPPMFAARAEQSAIGCRSIVQSQRLISNWKNFRLFKQRRELWRIIVVFHAPT